MHRLLEHECAAAAAGCHVTLVAYADPIIATHRRVRAIKKPSTNLGNRFQISDALDLLCAPVRSQRVVAISERTNAHTPPPFTGMS